MTQNSPPIMKTEEIEKLAVCVLGSGGYGYAFSAKIPIHGMVAVKMLHDCSADDDLLDEINILAKLRHKNIIGYIGYTSDPIAIVMELAEKGSLATYMKQKKSSVSLQNVIRIVNEIALGMEYIHKCDKLHLDLKASNVLLDKNTTAKISDFGLSKVRWYIDSCTQSLTTSDTEERRGTFSHIAPEKLEDSKVVPSRKYDVYSYGIVIWEVMSSKRPYGDLLNKAKISEFVLSNKRPPMADMRQDTPRWLKNLMEQCWLPNYQDRPYFSDIVRVFEKVECAAITEIDTQQESRTPVGFPHSLGLTKDLKLGRYLGMGKFGLVLSAEIPEKGEVVLKIMKTNPFIDEGDSRFKADIIFLEKMEHEHIIRVHGYTMDAFAIVMEFAEHGSVTEYFEKQRTCVLPRMDAKTKTRILHEVSLGMKYLHNFSPLNCCLDLKADNILLDNQLKAKISGFRLTEPSADAAPSRISLSHSAPETLSKKEYTAVQGSYAYGILIWEVMTEEIPYADLSDVAIRRKVSLGERPQLESDLWKNYEKLKGLMTYCWNKDSSERPSFNAIADITLKILNSYTELNRENSSAVPKSGEPMSVDDK